MEIMERSERKRRAEWYNENRKAKRRQESAENMRVGVKHQRISNGVITIV